MIAADTRQTDQATETLTLTRLAKLWAAGTGVALLLVAPAYLISQEFSDPLVLAGAGEVTLNTVAGFTILGAAVGAAVPVIGMLARWLGGDWTSVEA